MASWKLRSSWARAPLLGAFSTDKRRCRTSVLNTSNTDGPLDKTMKNSLHCDTYMTYRGHHWALASTSQYCLIKVWTICLKLLCKVDQIVSEPAMSQSQVLTIKPRCHALSTASLHHANRLLNQQSRLISFCEANKWLLMGATCQKHAQFLFYVNWPATNVSSNLAENEHIHGSAVSNTFRQKRRTNINKQGDYRHRILSAPHVVENPLARRCHVDAGNACT